MEKCKSILAIRKKQNLKYKDAQIRPVVTQNHGFHIECYRKFIALSQAQRKSIQDKKNDTNSVPLTRSRIPTPAVPVSSTGVFPKICIFCMKKEKHNNVKEKLHAASTENFQEKIKKYASWLNDQTMLLRIGTDDFVSKEIYYHGICRVNYQSRAEKTPLAKHKKNARGLDEPNLGTSWHVSRDLHCKAFAGICCLIDENVLSEREVILLSDLNCQYQMLLAEYGGEDYEDTGSNSTRLEKKMLQHYKNKIKVIKGKTRCGNLVVSSEISDEEALKKENSMKTKLNTKIRDVAFALRLSILEAEKVPIPDDRSEAC